MSFIPFLNLAPNGYALTDASSLCDIASHTSTLTCNLTPPLARQVLGDLDRFGLRPSLSLLERWIVIDHLVADLVALDTATHGGAVESFHDVYPSRNREHLAYLPRRNNSENKQTAFINHLKSRLLGSNAHSSKESDLANIQALSKELSISFTAIPFEIFTRCINIVRRTSQVMQDTHPHSKWHNCGFGIEKKYGELLDEIYEGAGCLARSHFNVERTLVYYETAATAGIPLILHPNRYWEAEAISSACVCAYESVKKVLRETFEESIRSQLDSLGVSYDIELPPLVSRVVEFAGKENISIVEAAKQIKQSASAVAFRKWLAEIQMNLADNSKGGKIAALKMLQELKSVAKVWVAELDTKAEVSYKKRELRLSMVPRIGGLLQLLENRNFKDPIINQKGYLTFISWWFDHEI